MHIQFLGANRQVTGSRYYLKAGGLNLLIDCGMFQEREFRDRNWQTSPFPPEEIDYVLLTHAHLDHSGLLPRFVKHGFNGTIITTAASRDLAEIILEDAGRIQEEDAAYKRKRHRDEGRKSPHPVEPLFTASDVKETMQRFQSVPYHEHIELGDHVSVTYHDAGHILGSAMLEIHVSENGSGKTILFSGDIGQWDKPIIRDPTLFKQADYVIMESTYATRDHDTSHDVESQLQDVITRAVEAGGNIVIPTFAIERAQELMYHLARLTHDDRIPNLMVFLDSPMAVNAIEVFRKHTECIDEEATALVQSGEGMFQVPGLKLVRSTRESKSINRIRGSCIVMAGSGMCTAGRIKHHLVTNVSRPESAIVFVGYQARGTLGRELTERRDNVRILGRHFDVKARIEAIHGLSAHAGRSDLLRWLKGLESPPKRLFLTHGEEDGALDLAEHLRKEWNWNVEVPEYQQEFEL